MNTEEEQASPPSSQPPFTGRALHTVGGPPWRSLGLNDGAETSVYIILGCLFQD